MERQWYLARAGQVYGPMTDAQLMHGAAVGQILLTDQLNVAGQPNWVAASALPWLFPAAANLIPAEVVEEGPVTLRVTCMACFRDVKVDVMPGDASANCPKCRSVIEIAAPAGDAAPAAQAAFANLESKREFKERLQKKVAEGQRDAANNGALVGGLIGGIIAGG